MKALPEAVQQAFPAARERLTDRPWWFASQDGGGPFGFCYRRVDGKVAYEPSPRNIMSVEGVDADYPLPHPGYRAGQVWAAEDGASLTIVQVERSGMYAGCATWGVNYEFARAYPYLMADPACPHLAPWSPCGDHHQQGEDPMTTNKEKTP
jgi:hypothetical protein